MVSAFDMAPPALRQIVVKTYDELTSLGVYTPEEVDRMVNRLIHHSGWYQTAGGWAQLGPDVRGKVNIRKAEPQSDGMFLVRDVDVFYPNAVKGKEADKVFTKEDIARAIINTNAAITAGGQKPALALEHPSPLRHLTGGTAKAYGSGINWRWSPRGENWVRVDLVDVAPEVIVDWRDHRWTGLSAGFANDADDLNLRFGHIALLGVETQALSQLPITEVFSAAGSVKNQLCFSTESRYFQSSPQKKEPNMDRKQAFAALKQSFSAMASAYASAEAGEPNFATKIQQAKDQFDATQKDFGAMGAGLGAAAGGGLGAEAGEMGGAALGGAVGGPPGAAIGAGLGAAAGGAAGAGIGGAAGDALGDAVGGMGGDGVEGGDAGQAQGGEEMCAHCGQKMSSAPAFKAPMEGQYNASQEPQELTWLPEAPQIPLAGGKISQVIDTPKTSAGSSFAAGSEFGTMKNTINELKTVISALKTEGTMSQFSAFCTKAKSMGHVFDEKNVGEMFSAALAANNKPIMDSVIALIKASPKAQSLAKMGTTFSAQDADNPSRVEGEVVSRDAVQELIRQHARGVNFSAQDFALGDAFGGF